MAYVGMTVLNADRDVIGLAQTGSGKTGAFALPILEVSYPYIAPVRQWQTLGFTPQPQSILFSCGCKQNESSFTPGSITTYLWGL